MERSNMCPLHSSVREERWSDVLRLVAEGADVTCNSCGSEHTGEDSAGETPLHVAVGKSNAPIKVLNKLISPCDINFVDSRGESALHRAIRAERWDLVLLLVQDGADVDCSSIKSPFQLAIEEKCHTVPLQVVLRLISPRNVNGSAALHNVVDCKRWDLVPTLIQHGADVNTMDSRPGWPRVQPDELLPLAIRNDVPSNVLVQLLSCENINMSYVNNTFTLLHFAVVWQRWDLVPILIRHGADVNIVNRDNDTPLHLALNKDVPADVLPQLISADMNINEKNATGYTCMNIAILKATHTRRLAAVNFLAGYGGMSLHNLIHVVISYRGCDSLKVLLQHLATDSLYTHVRFTLARLYSRVRLDMYINDIKVIHGFRRFPVALGIEAEKNLPIVTAILHLLSGSTLLKVDIMFQSNVQDGNYNSVDTRIWQTLEQFEHESHNPEKLTTICILRIRQHVPVKTDDNLSRLGLPPVLMRLVKLAPLAEEMQDMMRILSSERSGSN